MKLQLTFILIFAMASLFAQDNKIKKRYTQTEHTPNNHSSGYISTQASIIVFNKQSYESSQGIIQFVPFNESAPYPKRVIKLIKKDGSMEILWRASINYLNNDEGEIKGIYISSSLFSFIFVSVEGIEVIRCQKTPDGEWEEIFRKFIIQGEPFQRIYRCQFLGESTVLFHFYEEDVLNAIYHIKPNGEIELFEKKGVVKNSLNEFPQKKN